MFRSDEAQRIRQQPIQPILERTLALVKPHAQEHGVAIHVPDGSHLLAMVDSDYLLQALMNLLLNAIDASGDKGRVDVSLDNRNSHVEIAVEDSGQGLTMDQRKRIFEAFYTTKPGGIGLGLAVTKTLLEKMGGSIESQNGSRGALFRVVLPDGQPA